MARGKIRQEKYPGGVEPSPTLYTQRFQEAVGKGYLQFVAGRTGMAEEIRVEYLVRTPKRYRIADPEESVRAAFYVELIEKYQYPRKRIDFEVEVPRRQPEDHADIVVYADDDLHEPYIVVECKPEGISEAEFRQAIEQAFGNANSLRAKYAIVVAGTRRTAFDVAGFKPQEREKNVIGDLPVHYGKPRQFRFIKADPQWDLHRVDMNELKQKFQQCHDVIWEGGKRTPAEAFDEMSKLLFCKSQDEQVLTDAGKPYQFQIRTHETPEELAGRIRHIYETARRGEPSVFEDPIKVTDGIIYAIVERIQEISFASTDLDAKGRAFETFMGSVFRGEMGQYFTPRKIVEFMVEVMQPSHTEYVVDPSCGSGGFLLYAMRHVREQLKTTHPNPKEYARRELDFSHIQVYGIEINDMIARVAMMDMVLHEDGHSNIKCADALDDFVRIDPRADIRPDRFDVLLTNPPFGSVIHQTRKPYLSQYELGGKTKLRKSQKTEILFIERSLDMLRPGGRMGIVLPEGILSNSSLQYVRDFVMDRAQILAVVSLPQTTFTPFSPKGGGVKSSLLFLRKKREGEALPKDYPIFMAIADHVGYDATGRPDKNDLSSILQAYREFQAGRSDFSDHNPVCVVTRASALRARLDASYHARGVETPYPCSCQPLGEIVEFSDERWRRDQDGREVFRYVEISRVDPQRVEITHAVDLSVANAPSRAQMVLRAEDILVSLTRPSRGSIARVGRALDGAVGSTGFAVIREVKKGVSREYLLHVLRSEFCLRQMEQRASGGNYPAITETELAQVMIPMPPIEVQIAVGRLLEAAYEQKLNLQKRASELETSVPEWLYEQLGIPMGKVEDRVVFVVSGGLFQGGRLDAYFAQPKYRRVQLALREGRYQVKYLRDVVQDVTSGATPDAADFSEDGVPLLRITNVREGRIDLASVRRIRPPVHAGMLRRSQLRSGDVIMSIAGTLGVAACVPAALGELNINQDFARLVPKPDVSGKYLAIYLESEIGRILEEQQSNGATHPHLNHDTLGAVLIPVPPREVQEGIADEISRRQNRVRDLRQESEQVVTNARKTMEAILLGQCAPPMSPDTIRVQYQQVIETAVHKLVAEMGPSRVILFGSMVWGEPAEQSDIDMAVFLSTDKAGREDLRRAMSAVADSSIPVDVVVYGEKDAEERRPTWPFIRRILEEGKLLYSRVDSRVG